MRGGEEKAKSRVHEINLLACSFFLSKITEKEKKFEGKKEKPKHPKLVNEQRTFLAEKKR